MDELEYMILEVLCRCEDSFKVDTPKELAQAIREHLEKEGWRQQQKNQPWFEQKDNGDIICYWIDRPSSTVWMRPYNMAEGTWGDVDKYAVVGDMIDIKEPK